MNSDKAQHILVTAPLGFGGITSMMINIQKNLDRDKLNFDYLVLHDRHEDLEDIVLGMGSKKIVASADDVRNNFLRGITRWYRLYRTFKDNNNQGSSFKWWPIFRYEHCIPRKACRSKTCDISYT